jgi:pimeloyl-ACP methyl ester carboxylesterase
VLGYDRIGEGDPLVLLHPLGADRHVWDAVARRLAPEHDVITIDLPGFGDSPPLKRDAPTPAALAAAVHQQLTELGVEAPDVVGNSLGGDRAGAHKSAPKRRATRNALTTPSSWNPQPQ